MTAQPTSVIFDIGKVLIEWDPRALFEKLIDDAEELDWFLAEVVSFGWHHEHDRGMPFAASLAAKAMEYPDYTNLIYAYRERWRETIPGPIKGVVDILRTLDNKGVSCFALTNYSAETWPELEAEFDWIKCFRDIVVSGREGLVKPEMPIYHLARERFGLRAGEGLFIDDRLENITSGEAAGFVGHHFIDVKTLEADLKERNLL
ncbi:MAG: HAD family phosphatase [Alphaproteobacteria bacterium]|nr:MAG: HAD family phosphatase [Alphaproteobacteria bacterium]